MNSKTKGPAGVPNATAAQSRILALNDTQFLVLARDSLGRGEPLRPSIGVLLIDTRGATNIAGTHFETGTTPVAEAVSWRLPSRRCSRVELVNILNTTQLAKNSARTWTSLHTDAV